MKNSSSFLLFSIFTSELFFCFWVMWPIGFIRCTFWRVWFIYEYTFRRTMTILRIETSVPHDSNIYLVKGRSAVLIDTGTGLDS